MFIIRFLFLSLLFICVPISTYCGSVQLGVDVFIHEGHLAKLSGKNVALITNHTGISSDLKPTFELLLNNDENVNLVALFAPEHGLYGHTSANEENDELSYHCGIPVYSLYGKTRRPTDAMLKGVEVLIYDIQDIGCRSYTYSTTLFYVMEEAAKRNIPVIVLDRPNPINGLLIDGPMLEESWRSFLGYVNVPYCHGMTIGELARYFNTEYQIGCKLTVVAMKGWKRSMSFKETGLPWIPTSPYIPESDSPLFYATTGLIGELGIVSIGIGYTLPFKVIGAPWIKAQKLADALNAQKLSGVRFVPFYFRPHFGLHKGADCEGVLIVATKKEQYKPLTVQYLILGVLKSLYPQQFQKKLASIDPQRKNLFCMVSGNSEMLSYLTSEKYVAWKLIQYQKSERELFAAKRSKFLLYR